MKYITLLVITFVAVLNTTGQNFGITYTNYSNGQILRSGNIETAFTITNYGPAVLNAGDKIYVAAKINGTLYKLDLTAAGPDVITLTQSLPVNGTYNKDPGHLNGALTLSFLNTSSVDVCMLVYGKDATSVGSDFPSDPDPSNNNVCVTYTNSVATATLNPFDKTIDMNVYPNPAINEINFQFSTLQDLKSIVLTDLSGKKIKEATISNLIESININGLQSGMYFYSINSTSGVVSAGRIVIQE